MRNRLSRFLTFAILVLAGFGCATAPITGRSQLILVSEADEARLGTSAFAQLKQKALREGRTIPQDDGNPTHKAAHAQIQAVIGRLSWVADPHKRYRWEYVLLNDPKTANAGALPGGKIIVWSGILSVTQGEAGLAAVLGHELGHVLAHHAAERISQQQLTGLVGTAIQAGLPNTQGGKLLGAALGLGTEVGILLPYSRLQESEADRIGLLLMAKAGYDPREALALWDRMAAEGGARGPEWLSTHPSPATRRAELERLMPEALRYFQNPTLLLPGLG
jgi:predicted Zn-dependent protease